MPTCPIRPGAARQPSPAPAQPDVVRLSPRQRVELNDALNRRPPLALVHAIEDGLAGYRETLEQDQIAHQTIAAWGWTPKLSQRASRHARALLALLPQVPRRCERDGPLTTRRLAHLLETKSLLEAAVRNRDGERQARERLELSALLRALLVDLKQFDDEVPRVTHRQPNSAIGWLGLSVVTALDAAHVSLDVNGRKTVVVEVLGLVYRWATKGRRLPAGKWSSRDYAFSRGLVETYRKNLEARARFHEARARAAASAERTHPR